MLVSEVIPEISRVYVRAGFGLLACGVQMAAGSTRGDGRSWPMMHIRCILESPAVSSTT